MRLTRDPSKLNRTEAALLTRGIDSATAASLRQQGWTLGKLKQAAGQQLEALGLSTEQVAAIHKGRRPEIPFESLTLVLVANRFTCCVCRDPAKAIVVHHIHDWSESHDHSPSNLAVLCLEHHDRAHTVSSLSRNLNKATLASMKDAWEKKVARTDVSAVLQASQLDGDAWWYFNHVRLFEVASHLGVRLARLPSFRGAWDSGLVQRDGWLRPRPENLSYMYSGMEGMILYAYVRSVMHAVLDHLTVFNASDYLDRGILASVVSPGDFVFVQGAHSFSRAVSRDDGRDQTARAVRRANHVEFRYTFDCWEATSNSAWSTWLRGRQEAASLLRVVDVSRSDRGLTVTGTVFGICMALPGLKEREYASAPYRRGIVVFDESNEKSLFERLTD